MTSIWSQIVTMASKTTFLLVIVSVTSTRMFSTSAAQAIPNLCTCPLHYAPVCASNGKTFSNMCEFTCTAESEVTILHQGKCRGQICPCPKIYAPVCASNEQTYGNPCTLQCHMKKYSSLSFVKDGPCELAKADNN